MQPPRQVCAGPWGSLIISCRFIAASYLALAPIHARYITSSLSAEWSWPKGKDKRNRVASRSDGFPSAGLPRRFGPV